MILRRLLIGMGVAVALAWSPLMAADSLVDVMTLTHHLAGTASQTVIVPAGLVSPNATDTQHVFLPVATEQVVVDSRDYGFEEELESFHQFRSHYAVYWAIFNTLMLSRAVWTH